MVPIFERERRTSGLSETAGLDDAGNTGTGSTTAATGFSAGIIGVGISATGTAETGGATTGAAATLMRGAVSVATSDAGVLEETATDAGFDERGLAAADSDGASTGVEWRNAAGRRAGMF